MNKVVYKFFCIKLSIASMFIFLDTDDFLIIAQTIITFVAKILLKYLCMKSKAIIQKNDKS